MAMNDCQKMAVADFYKSLRNISATWRNMYDRLEQASEWLNNADATTYPSDEVPTATLSDIAALRTAINDQLASTETAALLDAVNKLRYMS